MSTPSLNLCTILSESKRIIKEHSRHFLSLSVIFLLPPSFSVLVYPTLQQLLLHDIVVKSFISHPYYTPASPSPSMSDKQTLILSVTYTLFVLVLSLCAVGSISYSVFHGFYGRPVKLVSSLKSILYSFLPLIVTTLVSYIILSGFVALFACFLFLVVKIVKLVGFHQFDYTSPHFMSFSLVLLIGLVLFLIYLQVNWTLVSVIVVLESCWGIKPLKRSAHLIKKYKLLAVSMYFYFSILVGILFWSTWEIVAAFGKADGWKSWAFVVQIVIASTLLTLLLLYMAAANTVLYMYCKAIHGELAVEIAEEFARDYERLPFDDGKIPHLVSVVYTT